MDFLGLKYNAFGLDINDLSVKIVKLEKKRGKFFITSSGKQDLKPGTIESGAVKNEKALSEAIKSAYHGVKGKKIRSKYAVISLPEEESFLQVIQMPKMTQQELKSAVVFEAENYIPLPIDQMYLDFQIIHPLKNSLDHIDVLVVATPKQIVNSYVSCVKAAGLIPLSAEVESQSIIRAIVKNEMSEYPIILMDVGKNNVDFIIHSGNSIRFTYSVPLPHSQMVSAVAEAMNLRANEAEKLKTKYGVQGFDEKSSAEAKKVFNAMATFLDEFITQVKKNIDFYQEHASHEHLFNDSKIKKIILCGGGATFMGLVDFVSKKTGIQAEVGDPMLALPLQKNKGIRTDLLSFTTALGLAAGAVNFDEIKPNNVV